MLPLVVHQNFWYAQNDPQYSASRAHEYESVGALPAASRRRVRAPSWAVGALGSPSPATCTGPTAADNNKIWSCRFGRGFSFTLKAQMNPGARGGGYWDRAPIDTPPFS